MVDFVTNKHEQPNHKQEDYSLLWGVLFFFLLVFGFVIYQHRNEDKCDEARTVVCRTPVIANHKARICQCRDMNNQVQTWRSR